MKKLAALIILLFPFFSAAHGAVLQFDVAAGALPGQKIYPVKTAGEWLNLNLFTVSTKAKQAKRLALADKKLAEILALSMSGEARPEDFQAALDDYRYYLASAEDMAEKIVFLDGAEIGIARDFEARTRLHEEVALEHLEDSKVKNQVLRDVLSGARVQNRRMFTFMVVKYQLADEDIRVHKIILGEHMAIVRKRLADFDKDISNLLLEAQKYRNAGLNLKAYSIIEQAKDLVY